MTNSRYIIRTFTLLLAIGWSTVIWSQEGTAWKFDHYGVEQGLAQSSANAMIQDKDDMLWIGTFGGLSSFDGYNFRSYQHNRDDPKSLSENVVWVLLCDSQNTLWAGTKNGLSRLDRINGVFDNYYIDDHTSGSNTLAIKALLETHSGDLLIGTEGKGVFLFNRISGQFKAIEVLPSTLKVASFQQDKEGNIYVGTENEGLFSLSENYKESISYLASGEFISPHIWSLLIDSDDKLWIGTEGAGLASSLDKHTFTLGAIPTDFEGIKIQCLQQDSDGVIWIGTATHGLYTFEGETGRVLNYAEEEGSKNGLFNSNVTNIVLSTNGNVFVGFYLNGFDKLLKVPFHNYSHNPKDISSLSDDHVFSMYRDHSDNLWVGTFGGGLNLIQDGPKKSFKHYRHDSSNPLSLSHDWVRCMFEDSRGNFWVGTWGGGLNLMDRATGNFKRISPDTDNPDASISLNIITTIYEDSRGVLWLGTYGAGIDLYDATSNTFSHIRHDEQNANSLSDDHITSFHEDDQGFMWIATYGGGLNRYDPETRDFLHFVPQFGNDQSISEYKVLHLFPDDDHLWITTLGGGINKLDLKNHTFQVYMMKDGLSNDNTLGMIRHSDGTYWISTNYGLNHFDPETEQFTVYTSGDGICGIDFSLSAFMVDKEGYFYFGGKNGITSFNPDQVTHTAEFPKLAFHVLKVADEGIRDWDDLKIDYKDRIAFEFSAVNPQKVEKINYAYKVIGLDMDWRDIGFRRELEFESFRPGHYEIRIRSNNDAGLWNPDFISFPFEIVPPWYMTWWFRIAALLFVFVTAIGYYFRRIGNLKRQKRELVKRVNRRTETIQKRNMQLREAYQQQVELERFKDSLVNMVAHDLKNPLVSIMASATDKMDESATEIIQRSGQNMLLLIDNMLDVQRLEDSAIQLNPSKFDLACLVESIFNGLSVLAKNKSLQFWHNLPAPCLIQADRALIERVIINLLTNAIKFSPVSERVSIEGEQKGQLICITVFDRGRGVAEEDQQRIFDKFYQSQARSMRGSRSFGLGLTFCKLVVEAHGSEIKLVSEPGKGSSFSFCLPLVSKLPASPPSDTLITEYNSQEKWVEMSLSDKEYLQSHSELFDLDMYQTGEWYRQIDFLKELESDFMEELAARITKALVNFDAHYLEEIRSVLKEKMNN